MALGAMALRERPTVISVLGSHTATRSRRVHIFPNSESFLPKLIGSFATARLPPCPLIMVLCQLVGRVYFEDNELAVFAAPHVVDHGNEARRDGKVQGPWQGDAGGMLFDSGNVSWRSFLGFGADDENSYGLGPRRLRCALQS